MIYNIVPDKTALLIIDMQREYFDNARPLFTANGSAIVGAIRQLRNAAARAGVRTIMVKHVHRADGADVGRMGDFDPTPVFTEGEAATELLDEFTPRENELLVIKTRYSAFVNTDLDAQLKSVGIDTIIVTGMMTNYCCVTTARHAHDLDYKVVFAVDANAGPDMPDLGFGAVPHHDIMRVVATSLAGGVADVVNTSELLAQLSPAATPAEIS